MPAGLANLLADRQQFLDLVAYLAAVAEGGPARAAELAPDPLLLAAQAPAAYEREIDHAGFIADWSDPEKARGSFERGEKIFSRVCANCHGTLEQPGSLPTAPRFAEGRFKAGSDPYAIYRTLTYGNGMMVPQTWMVPSQKYDVIHYLRETFLKDRNPAWYTAVTPAYLASLPTGTSRGPAASLIEPWRLHDYGPFLAGTFEVGGGGGNIARKGLAIRLDEGPGGVGRGHDWVLYELDTLRAAAFWTGERFIDWAGINFDGRHGAHPRVAGDVQATLATMPGWAEPATGSFADPRPLGRDGKPYGPLPREHVRFRSLHHVDLGGTAAEPKSGVVLDYTVGQTPVLEMPSLAMPLEIARAGRCRCSCGRSRSGRGRRNSSCGWRLSRLERRWSARRARRSCRATRRRPRRPPRSGDPRGAGADRSGRGRRGRGCRSGRGACSQAPAAAAAAVAVGPAGTAALGHWDRDANRRGPRRGHLCRGCAHRGRGQSLERPGAILGGRLRSAPTRR